MRRRGPPGHKLEAERAHWTQAATEGCEIIRVDECITERVGVDSIGQKPQACSSARLKCELRVPVDDEYQGCRIRSPAVFHLC
jgi:hypothetical protein